MKIKKLTALLAAGLLSVCAVPVSAGAEENGVRTILDSEIIEEDVRNDYQNSDFSKPAELGDVNHDGFVDAVDATMIAVYYGDLSTHGEDLYTEEQHENFRVYGDVSGDGYVNSIDSTFVLIQYADNATNSGAEEIIYDEEITMADGTVRLASDLRNDYLNSDFSKPAELGDVNHDGLIDDVDAYMIAVYYGDLSTHGDDLYTEEQHENFRTYGDVSGDGYVNSIDTTLILIQYADNAAKTSE